MEKLESILEYLNDIRYDCSSIPTPETLKELIENNLVKYSLLISHLSKELSRLCNIDEHINPIESNSEEETFYLEIGAFLKEINVPFKCLREGSVSERFKNYANKLRLLDFLLSELLAARILISNKPEFYKANKPESSNESVESRALKDILVTLGFPKPPSNITPNEIWNKIEVRVKELLAKLPKDYIGKPLLNLLLNDDQWHKLMEINKLMSDDFQMRRELLLTRLDVTIQSFKWADRLKANNSEISNIYNQKRKELVPRHTIKIYEIIAARDDLCKQEKTCSSRLMTRSELHKIIIPKVPDRGGRTCELEPPPPDMPMFMQRKQSAHPQEQRQNYSGGGRGGSRGGGHRSENTKWCNEGMSHHRPQSDFERFQNQDYTGGGGRNYNGGRGGGGRGGGNRGRGGRHY